MGPVIAPSGLSVMPLDICNDACAAQARFDIPPHIYLCVTGPGTVILDAKRDKYLALGREETELLAEVVPGWPRPLWQPSMLRDGSTTSRANELCESLVEDEVLERSFGPTERRLDVSLGDMRGEWLSIGDEIEVSGRVTLRHVLNFLLAYGWARFSLAWRPFSAVVAEVRARKRGWRGSCEPCDVRDIAAMVDIFRKLRPFVFAPEGRCLLHALTLVRFLSHYQLHPDWLLGVTLQPWGAHSWVQWHRFLLDTNPEKVCAYTPILKV